MKIHSRAKKLPFFKFHFFPLNSLLISLAFVLCSFFWLPKAQSYIPRLSSILSRVTKNHGNGLYLVVQEISFKEQFPSDLLDEKTENEEDSSNKNSFFSFINFFGKEKKTKSKTISRSHSFKFVTIRERWWIKNAETMRLEIEGIRDIKNQIRETFIYNGSHKYWLSSSEEIEKSDTNSQGIEAFFHYRQKEEILNRMKRENIFFINGHSSPSRKKNTNFNYPEQTRPYYSPFIHLVRVAGKVTYGIGKLSSSESLYPGLWIEQDHFLIKKIRLIRESKNDSISNDSMNNKKPEQDVLEVVAKDYKIYRYNLWFPQIRKIQWKGKEIFVKLIDIQSIKASRKYFETSNPKDKQEFSLKEKSEKEVHSIQWIKEFYHQWR